MNRFLSQPFDHQQSPAAAILLVNLGTPDAPDTASVRRYLAEFLSDPRVVEQPRWLWWPVLHGIILRLRPRRSAHAYQSIWTAQGSPLLTGTQALAQALQSRLTARSSALRVAVAMRYGTPDIASALAELEGAGVRRLLVLPLYPQYSATTTASVWDALSAALQKRRRIPDLQVVSHYFDHPTYIEALAHSVRQAWAQRGTRRHLMISFHGIPKRYVRTGDPYYCHCLATARLLAEALALSQEDYSVCFQSRVGREPWLQPYTDQLLRALPSRGVRSVDVLCPGFAIDCLETLEEIAIANRDLFLAAGGDAFDYLPALNDSKEHVDFLAELVRQRCQWWPEWHPAPASESDQLRGQRWRAHLQQEEAQGLQ